METGTATVPGVAAIVFHITTRAAWEEAQARGSYEDPSLESEGFIHCSDLDQVAGSADAHFAGVPDLVLLCIAVDRLEAPLRYEHSADGRGDFPHLYGRLNPDAVLEAVPLPEGDGGFAVPAAAARLLDSR